jgi:hypothetical protein
VEWSQACRGAVMPLVERDCLGQQGEPPIQHKRVAPSRLPSVPWSAAASLRLMPRGRRP